MKVTISQRRVYHKYVEVEIEIPDNVDSNDIHEYLTENEELYNDKIDKALDKAEYKFGFGCDEYGMYGSGIFDCHETKQDVINFAEQYANQKIAEALIAFQKGEIEVEESLTEKGKVTFLWGDKELEQKQK